MAGQSRDWVSGNMEDCGKPVETVGIYPLWTESQGRPPEIFQKAQDHPRPIDKAAKWHFTLLLLTLFFLLLCDFFSPLFDLPPAIHVCFCWREECVISASCLWQCVYRRHLLLLCLLICYAFLKELVSLHMVHTTWPHLFNDHGLFWDFICHICRSFLAEFHTGFSCSSGGAVS